MANSYSSVTTQPAKIESDNPFLGKENKPAQRVSGASAPPTISQNSAPSSNTGVKFPTKLGAASGDDALGAEMPDNDETVAYVNKLIHRYELANENNESVIIDWLTFTMPLAAIHPNSHEMDLYRVGQYLSLMLQRCLGYGILDDVYRGPRHNYKRAFVLGEKGWGFVGLGGNNDTACISIAGSGLMAARDGWETMLHGFLMRMNARITRIDLALDLWKGGYHPQQAAEDYVNGKFVTGGRWPEARQEGNWLRQNGKGLTFYVGDDRNGYSQRVYEKGKQLRIQNSDWQRIEGTMTNGNKNVVPFDVLLSPTECFRKLYPVNAELIKGSESACRIKTKKLFTPLSMTLP